MDNIHTSAIHDPTENILEGRLRKVLRPVNPDPGFVQKLRNRLSKKAEVYLEQDNPSIHLLLILVGLVAVIVVYWIMKLFLRK